MNTEQDQSLQEQSPSKKPSENDTQLIAYRESFHGPLPHPNQLAQYDKVLPGLADRITKMAENQASHRQTMERRLLWFDGFKHISGQLFALIIVVIGILAGLYLTIKDKPLEGFFAGFTPLATIAAVFLYQRGMKKP